MRLTRSSSSNRSTAASHRNAVGWDGRFAGHQHRTKWFYNEQSKCITRCSACSCIRRGSPAAAAAATGTHMSRTSQFPTPIGVKTISLRPIVRTGAQLTERELTIKLSIAQSTDRLDLSGCSLTEVPSAVFELTNLIELSLSGNQLQELPAEIGNLSNLQRLVVAGNWLTQLPEELLQLLQLEGLWVHGNLLQHVPEQLGQLSKLKHLSFAGNCLETLPDSLTQLVHLQDLNVSGNVITSLPEGIGALTALKNLALHGNLLTSLPEQGWQHLDHLDEITLQGNLLTEVPPTLAELKGLTELSLADNQLRNLPDDLSALTRLQKLHLYGNQLTSLPIGRSGLAALQPSQAAVAAARNGNSNGSSRKGPMLASLWLEGNPLRPDCVAELLAAMGPAGTTRVGLDDQQVVGPAAAEHDRLKAAGNRSIRRGTVQVSQVILEDDLSSAGLLQCMSQLPLGLCRSSSPSWAACWHCDVAGWQGQGPGYFKLQYGPGASSSSSSSRSSDAADRVLVVAFGSAPGLPNWGGVMRKVYAAAEAPEHSCFDVLYVVDPGRTWYCGGDLALMEQRYTSRLRQYTERYKHVVMLGDSMGASAALLFSPLATAVLSFCPQVDLTTSSIRPGQPPAWQAALQAHLQAAVAASGARMKVFTGTWEHDVDQANLLTHHPHVQIKVYSVDSHRLALSLAARGTLAPLVREVIMTEMGISSGNVRLANLL